MVDVLQLEVAEKCCTSSKWESNLTDLLGLVHSEYTYPGCFGHGTPPPGGSRRSIRCSALGAPSAPSTPPWRTGDSTDHVQ